MLLVYFVIDGAIVSANNYHATEAGVSYTNVVSLRRLNNTATRVIPAKHDPAKAGSRNPEAIYGGFRVKHGMTYCMVITVTLH